MSEHSGSLRMRLPAAIAGFLAFVIAACRGDSSAPTPGRSAADVIATHSAALMSIPGVVGVYQGESHGRTVLRVMVYSRADSTYKRIPRRIEGYPVEIEVGGYIRPMNR